MTTSSTLRFGLLVFFALFNLGCSFELKAKQQADVPYVNTIRSFFNDLFNSSCAQWISHFQPQVGSWLHPSLPNGATGEQQLTDFCKTVNNQFSTGASFKPSSDLPLLTHSGSLVYASIPYVFSGNQPQQAPFVNWGNVFFAFIPVTGNENPQIHFAVESWQIKRW
eukprot:TRINITY_DN3808_c0_g1_i1.p1 TRINITY_DN3808_c0_g1~~TRINITY_DN3808_c0_g1_i1.p1  ORF type:complete len:184 (+),score=54.27 TRINITY_DN3808_c0_g1_i1:55-552(+)